MYQFKEIKMSYDGYDLSKIGWYSIGKPSYDLSYQLGLSRNANFNEGIEYEEFKNITYDLPELKITFCKLDNNFNALEITKEDKKKLLRILNKKTPRSLVINNREYVGVFTNLGEAWKNNANKGYIEFTFKMTTPFALSNMLVKRVDCVKNESVQIKCDCVADEYIYPNITIVPLDNTTNVTIINESNYTKLEFKGLVPNNCYSINCFTEQCINENNPKENVFNKIEDTDNFIFFEYGVNDIKVISKNAKVVFMHKNKYIIDEE